MPELASAWVTLAVSSRGMKQDIKRALNEAERESKISPDVDSAKLSARSRAAGRRAGQDASREFSEAFSKGTSRLKLALPPLALGSLPAASTALATLAGALQQVTQAGLVAPGVIAGVVSSVATAKVGLVGVTDAFKALDAAASGSAKDIEKANEALAKLAPSARDAVRAGADIKKQFTDLVQQPVQDNLFRGLGDDARKLANADLPVVATGMKAIATSLNSNVRQAFTSLSSEASRNSLGKIFDNTADAQGRLTKAVDPLIHAFATLSATGSNSLPRLADGVGHLAERFDRFITSADQDGRLTKWIDEGITGIDHLGSTVMNVAKSFTAITKAAGGGEGLLGTLDKGTASVARFLNSAAGQDKLSRFFSEGREQLGKMQPLIQALPGLFEAVYTASKRWTDVLLPPLGQIAGLLSEHPKLVELMAGAWVAKKVLDGPTQMLGALGHIGSAFDGLPGRAQRSVGGINGALKGIAIPAALMTLLAQGGNALNNPNAAPSAGDSLAAMGGEVASGAAAGAAVAGIPGAAAGAAVGAAKSVFDRAQGDLARGRAENERRAEADRAAGPNRPGSPDIANQVTGRDKILQPSLNAPSLRDQVAAGQVPGLKIDPATGAIVPRAFGAIVAAMAGGGLRFIDKPQSAGLYQGRGLGTLFAEEETGGEAYIPLAPGKRARSMQILMEVARRFGLNRNANGSITADELKSLASTAEGNAYNWGGPAGPASDCSGVQSWIANEITGASGRFGTGDEAQALLARGFQQGDPPAGIAAYWIGWKNGGPGGGHTAGTIIDPDGGNVNVEMGGRRGNGQYGGSAAGASEFPNRAWIALAAGDDPKNKTGTSAAVKSAQASVTSAKASTTSAQNSVDKAQKELDDLKAKGASQDKITAGEKKLDVAQQKLTAAQERQSAAETRLSEVKDKAASKAEKTANGNDAESTGKSIASGLFGGLMESIGLPGFANLLEAPNVKSLQAFANAFSGPLKGAMEGKLGIQQPGWVPGMPIDTGDGNTTTVGLPGGGGGGLPSIGLPGVGDFMKPIPEAGLDPMTHQGSGAAPGPTQGGPTFVVNGNVGMDPRSLTQRFDAAHNQAYRSSGMSAVRPGG